jgi:hypothetical protein
MGSTSSQKQSQIQKMKLLTKYEDGLLSTSGPKLMKASMIFKMDFADYNTLQNRMSTLLSKTNNEVIIKYGVVPVPRDGHSSVFHNNLMYVFGGDRNKFPFNDLYSYEI